MLQRELTFYCRADLTLPDARQLQRLASLLQARVRVRLYNLTRGRQADVQVRLALLTLGCRAGDLCQLVMSGVDAELATLVFSAWVNEQGELLNGRHPDFTTSRQRLAQVAPDLCFTPAMLASLPAALQPATVDKPALLQQLLALLPLTQAGAHAALLDSLLAREALSATSLAEGLAMPHALTPWVSQPMLAVLHSPQALDWHSALGPVQLLILLLVPAPPQPAHLVPLTRLARKLMDPLFAQALLRCDSPVARHALLTLALTPAEAAPVLTLTAESASPDDGALTTAHCPADRDLAD